MNITKEFLALIRKLRQAKNVPSIKFIIIYNYGMYINYVVPIGFLQDSELSLCLD